jgi:DNA-binding response OmpR family regulator
MTENRLKFLKHTTLLLVEDDHTLLENIKETLSLFFKEIYTAMNGEEALTVYKKKHIDVIITDYVMPIKSGYEFCLEIRQNNHKIPIVIMSNHSDKEKLLHSIPLNLTQYLLKPINYQEIIHTLMNIIDKLETEHLLFETITKDMVYNKSSKTLIKNSVPIGLTKNEVLLVELFLENKNVVLSLESIELALSPYETKSDQAIKNIIHRLRQKIGKHTILNNQGLGYIFKEE